MNRYKLIFAVFVVLLFSPAVRAETVTVAAFGDSLTAGYGLPEEEGFTAQLEAWLADNGADVRIVNAGVSGDTTAGGLSRIAWTLTDEVDAVIVELGANDLLRGLPPEAARDNLQGIMETIAQAGLPSIIAGMPAPPNFGDAYKSAFDAIYPELAAQYEALYYPNFLAGIGEAGDLASVRALLQSDGLHPNKEGVARVVDHIGPMVLELVAKVKSST